MQSMRFRVAALAAGVVAALAGAAQGGQVRIAVFGDNATDDLLQQNGFSTQIVSDAQLSQQGFLDSFDIFYYTRDGTSFGESLSQSAINNVRAFVQNRYVLFNSDFADDTGFDDQGPDPAVQRITINAATWVSEGGRGGYIGEFNGTFAAFGSNDGGYNPLGLVQGDSQNSGSSGPPYDGNINLAINHPVLQGVNFPFNPTSIEFGSRILNADPNTIIATWDDGSASILAGAIPAPGAAALLGLGAGFASRRRR